MSKHTPGPWLSDEEGIVRTAIPFPHCPKYFKPVPVASAWREGAWVGDDGTDESRANARLMAAAPELLEFAQEVRRTGDTRLASMAVAVIAKTTGEHHDK